jgi:hypothetical protein
MKYCNINVTRLKNFKFKTGQLNYRFNILGNDEEVYIPNRGIDYSADYSDNYAFRALVDKVSIYDIEGLRTKIREIVRSHS